PFLIHKRGDLPQATMVPGQARPSTSPATSCNGTGPTYTLPHIPFHMCGKVETLNYPHFLKINRGSGPRWIAGIVRIQLPAERAAGCAYCLVSAQVDLFVLDRAPQPLHEHIVAPAGFRSMLMATLLRCAGR